MGLFRYVTAVLREITNIPAIRERSVVRSSVIPSAKYCWSGSLLRLANGRTTIERRGAANGCGIGVAVAAASVGADFVAGQSHHAPTAMSTVAIAPPIVIGVVFPRRNAGIVMLDG